MSLIQLAIRNAFRHRLRTSLTVLGLAMATMTCGLINTVIETWYAGVDASSNTRLIAVSSMSFTHPMPITHGAQMLGVQGATSLTWFSWFGGTYGTDRQPFTKLAVDANSYFDLFPEYVLSQQERQDFQRDRRGAIIGTKLASALHLQIGDTMTVRGDKFPGNWTFTVRGIYTPRDSKTDDAFMFVQWALVSEAVRTRLRGNTIDLVDAYVIGIADPQQASAVSSKIDALFLNSAVGTKTQTERMYHLAIVAMSRNVLTWLRMVSYGLIAISLLVLTNVITMSAAERTREYATLKAMGFSSLHLGTLLLTESWLIAATAVTAGIALTYPASALFVSSVGSLVNGFDVSVGTLQTQASMAVFVGLLAAIVLSLIHI